MDDIEVERDKIVGLVDLARNELSAEFDAALAADDMLTPGLGGDAVREAVPGLGPKAWRNPT